MSNFTAAELAALRINDAERWAAEVDPAYAGSVHHFRLNGGGLGRLIEPHLIDMHRHATPAAAGGRPQGDIKAIAESMIAAVRGAIERAIDPIGTRLSNVEFKVAAVLLQVAKGDPAKLGQLADVETLLQRIDLLESRLKSVESQ